MSLMSLFNAYSSRKLEAEELGNRRIARENRGAYWNKRFKKLREKKKALIFSSALLCSIFSGNGFGKEVIIEGPDVVYSSTMTSDSKEDVVYEWLLESLDKRAESHKSLEDDFKKLNETFVEDKLKEMPYEDGYVGNENDFFHESSEDQKWADFKPARNLRDSGGRGLIELTLKEPIVYKNAVKLNAPKVERSSVLNDSYLLNHVPGLAIEQKKNFLDYSPNEVENDYLK